MPIVWRLIVRSYLATFFLCFFASIGLGLLIKHKKMADYIASGAPIDQVILLSLCILSFSLPLLIGFSSLVTSFITSYKLSSSKEFIALSSIGLNIRDLFFPLYVLAFFFSCLSFLITSELIPIAKLVTNKIYLDSSNINPLILLRKNNLPFVKGIYSEMELKEGGKRCEDLLIAHFDTNRSRIDLFFAKELSFQGDLVLSGKEVSTLFYLPTAGETRDHLLIDRCKTMEMPSNLVDRLIEKEGKLCKLDTITFHRLFTKITRLKQSEICHRITLGLMPFCFSLLGLSFGLFTGRSYAKQTIVQFTLLFAIYLFSFFLIRKPKFPFILELSITIFLHVVVLSAAYIRRRNLEKGVIA